MANTFFKSFAQSDRTSSRTLLHEAIPITGAILSGTYDGQSSDGNLMSNWKTFSHGMFTSVYDYPYLSSSANHLFDVTYGVTTGSSTDTVVYYEQQIVSASLQPSGAVMSHADAARVQIPKKQNMYAQMAQILAGFDTDGTVRKFDYDGNLNAGSKIYAATFLTFSRLLVKDEIKKGSFQLVYATGSGWDAQVNGDETLVTFADTGAETNYYTNSPAGEYGLLYSTLPDGTSLASGEPRGLIFYQAGVVVLPIGSSVFGHASASATNGSEQPQWTPGGDNRLGVLTGSTVDAFNTGFLRRIHNIQFNNTIELNSTIYFCRANHNEFNYSSNPTYLSESKLRVKGDNIMAPPKSYPTTVGLYSADNELLAVAKLSEPLRKDPTNELTLRVRLDY